MILMSNKYVCTYACLYVYIRELRPELQLELQPGQPELHTEKEFTWKEWFDTPPRLRQQRNHQRKPQQQGTLPQQVQQQRRQ